MGTRYAAVFHAPQDIDIDAVRRDLQAAVDRVDGEMSTWKPASDLSRVNAAPPGKWIRVPANLFAVVEAALGIGEASGGAFEIGVGDAVEAFGFGASAASPDPARIAILPAAFAPAAERIELDHAGRRMRKRAPVRLDLSGIAKGFGVDELGRALDRHGVENYLVSIDGEVRARGGKPDGTAWAVGIERPDRSTRGAAGVVALVDGAIATSGDYRHAVSLAGRTLSHTIDPATARPVENRLASVTVIAQECMQADAWATALLVMGESHGPAFAIRHRMDALFLLRTPDGIDELATGSFLTG
ncbi:MAG: FAD:protein FMN transferase [Bauldia sp.]|nr:FAD:protein FMN transferase [Bauldia sp.]